jgi:hypothetical protein
MKRRLPIGIQDFVSIREDNFRYIDKTARIHGLISGAGKTFFLARPRRFGKSLLCSTLGALFEGRRELFTGLAIDGLPWGWEKHPVIRLDLNAGNYDKGEPELAALIDFSLQTAAKKYGVVIKGETISVRFAQLIADLHEKHTAQVAVIIDEYDKPLLSTIDQPEIRVKLRNALKGFYGVLKSADAHLRFVLLTGVTKFSQVSIFSDLNHIVDISFDPRYADLCGITQEELERDFADEINGIVQRNGLVKSDYMAKLKSFYNGYRFSKSLTKVYNPFGLLNHFDQNGEFSSYWYGTGTPTFLMRLIDAQNIDIFNLDNMAVSIEDFKKFDIESMKVAPVLYQSGYLTIADYDEEAQEFTLDYPNEEVRASFAHSLLDHIVPPENAGALTTRLIRSLVRGEIENAMDALKTFYKTIPYDLYEKREKFYELVIYLVFRTLGLNCNSEVRLADGRIDALVETKRNVYCFEFKLDRSADEALAQIDSKEYLLPWSGSGKKLFKVGVNFDHQARNISEWKWTEE